MSGHITTENRNLPLEKKLSMMHLLRHNMPQYKDMLDFFEPIIKEREKFKAQVSSSLDLHPVDEPILFEENFQAGVPLLAKNKITFDNEIMTGYFKTLLSIIKTKPNASMKSIETLINQNGSLNFKALLNEYLHPEISLPRNILLEFLINETLAPALKIYTEKFAHLIKYDKWDRGFCPVCGDHPVMSVLKDETGKRMLICMGCGSEWLFQRTKCPFCDNQEQHQLSYLFVENDKKYRIEVCDKCRQYLKTIDLRNTTDYIDYEIENIVTLHLDLIAREKGYTNGHPNDSPSAVPEFYN